MNQTIETLLAHRSIRKFTDQQIPEPLLQQLIEAGQAASTSSFIQATSVIQVTKPDNRLKIRELAGDQPYVSTAPVFLVFCADLKRNATRVESEGAAPDFAWTEQCITAIVDTSLFAQNVAIAAESMGLGICYIGGIRNDPEQVASLLELPELVLPLFGFCIGYPDQQPDLKPRLPFGTVFHQDSYKLNKNDDQRLKDYDSLVSEYYHQRSKGKFAFSWSGQMFKQSQSQSRPFMREFLNKTGFALK